MKNYNASLVLATATLALLSACGGGGDGSPVNGNSAPVAINAGNQTAVSRATVAGGLSVAMAQTANASDRAAAQAAGQSSASQGASVLELALRRSLSALRDPGQRAATARVHAADTQTGTTPCSVSGSFTSTFNDRDNNQFLSAGDSAAVTFNACRDSSTEAINGTLTIAVTSNVNSSSFSGTATFQQVTVTSGGATFAINGSVSLTETDTDDTISIGSGGMTVAVASSSYNDTITYSPGMAITTKTLSDPNETQLTLNGAFSATSIGGLVTLQTITPITTLDTDLYPSSGQLRVTGASGSVLLLTAANSTQLQMQLDAQGDGTYESSTLVNWSTLLPQ